MTRDELGTYLDNLLQASRFKDYCLNGLQVEGRQHIKKVITGVTACQALIDRAIEENADAILVHHGLLWKHEALTVTGMKKRRLSALLAHDINLFAYHLPLDAHETLGNNAQLAIHLGWDAHGPLGNDEQTQLIFQGEVPIAQTPLHFSQALSTHLSHLPLHIAGAAKTIQRIAWCTGAAQSFITSVLNKGFDAYISGEASEYTTHIARENGLHYFAAGHHATERYGIKALGEHIATQFELEHLFIDIPNPV